MRVGAAQFVDLEPSYVAAQDGWSIVASWYS